MRSAAFLVPLAVLAACTSGVEYQHAGSLAGSTQALQPFQGTSAPGVSGAALPLRWWHLYEDEKLDRYVESALAANTDLRAADANLRRAQALRREVAAASTLRTSLSAGLSAAGGSATANGAPFLSHASGVDLGYTVDFAGAVRHAIEAADFQSQAAQAARDLTRVITAAAVTRSYMRICSANVTLKSAHTVMRVHEQTFDAAVRLAQQGRGTRFDVERARTAVRRFAATLPLIRSERQTALYELAALLGKTPADYPRDAAGCDRTPEVSRPLPVGDGRALLERRPDVRAAERTLAAAGSLVKVRKAELYPTVRFGASASLDGQPGSLLRPSGFGFSLGPLMSWTFPNRDAATARIDQALAGSDDALARFDGTVLAALKNTEIALDAYAREREHVHELIEARASAELSSQDAGKLQRFGRISFLEVLSAQAAYADAEAALASARKSLVERQIDLFVALGGGWE